MFFNNKIKRNFYYILCFEYYLEYNEIFFFNSLLLLFKFIFKEKQIKLFFFNI